jgi:hypothetical protein
MIIYQSSFLIVYVFIRRHIMKVKKHSLYVHSVNFHFYCHGIKLVLYYFTLIEYMNLIGG